MTDSAATDPTKTNDGVPTPLLATTIEGLLLAILFVWVFSSELATLVKPTIRGQDVFSLVLPVAVVVLAALRWSTLRRSVSKGSWGGTVLVIAGLALYAACTWPFDYAVLRLFAPIPVLAGCLQVAAGWTALRRCLPFLLLLTMAVPLGPRKYADLVILPETLTLKIAYAVLDGLPGSTVSTRGSDLVYEKDGKEGTIALGESFRGMALLREYALVGVFVILARIRPWWQVVAAMAALPPIVLLANLFRFCLWGAVTIYGQCSPVSEIPRNTAGPASVLLTYLLMGAWCLILSRMVTEEEEEPADVAADKEAAHA